MEKGKDYCEISTAECFVILLLVLPIDVIFTQVYDQPFRGFVAALSAAVIVGLIWILRPLSGMILFWVCIGAVSLLHFLLVCFLPYTGDFRFGFVLFPVAVADIYGFGRLIVWVCRTRTEA